MEEKIKLLIVDDDLGMLKSLSYVLEAKGYDVVTLNQGTDAVEIIRKRKFDVVMSDIRMPGMDGIELIKNIKRITPDTSVVMMTAYTMHEKVKEAAEALEASFFEKDKMGGFWGFIKNLPAQLEDSMAAAGMATGGDLEDAIDINKEKKS